jgi:hypothetical protein
MIATRARAEGLGSTKYRMSPVPLASVFDTIITHG